MLDRLLRLRQLLGWGEKRCVYTCMIGEYERLNEQPVARESKIPFFCLTDSQNLRSETWRIVPVRPLFPTDPIRSQRMLKILPHRFMRGFETSLYIDNSVLLSKPPEEIFGRYFRSGDFALPTHSLRETLLDEFLEVERVRLDDTPRIFEQLNHVALSDPGVLLERPYWTGVLMRRRSKSLQRALDLWAMHVLRYSRRDQLSANVAFKAAGLTPQRIEIDNHHSWFHDWPIVAGRNSQNAARRPQASLGSVIAKLESSFGDDKALLDRIVSVQRQPHQQPANASFARCANGRIIYVDPADERSAHLIRTGGDFNPPTLAMWRLLLAEREWTHVVDVGANYGEMLLGADLPASAAVIAVEPNPNVLPYLKRSLGEAGIAATIVTEALSGQSGTGEFVIDRTWSGLSGLGRRLSPESAGHVLEILEVPTTMLDALVPRTSATGSVRAVVKLDVEGHEAMVLQGARELINGTDQFAALIEISHASDRDLDWMLSRFAIELYDPKAAALLPSAAIDAQSLRKEIAAKDLYRLDAVLRPRDRSGGSAA